MADVGDGDGPAVSSRYSPWVLRVNGGITSRPLTYLAAALFAVDGVSRLADGRVFRGVLNLVVSGALIALRARTRRAALRDTQRPPLRTQWALAHPVIAAVVMGAAWGSM